MVLRWRAAFLQWSKTKAWWSHLFSTQNVPVLPWTMRDAQQSTFWDRVCRGDVVKNCFILELPLLMLLDFCFLCLKLCGEGKDSSLIFRVIPTVKSYYWPLWVLLFSCKLLARVRAISSVVIQDPDTLQKGVFPLSCALCHLPGAGAGAGLCLTTLSAATCQTDKSQSSHWGRVWYQESSTTCSLAVSLSFFLFNFCSSVGWNISIYFNLPMLRDLVKELFGRQRANLDHSDLKGDTFGMFWGLEAGGSHSLHMLKGEPLLTQSCSVHLCREDRAQWFVL